jgi:hypothetical protein
MKKKVTITFTWWHEIGDDTPISPKHQEALEESAIERIQKMWNEGYSSGELYDTVRMFDEDGEDGISYSGWWELNTETIE